jgi:hypothetical protein
MYNLKGSLISAANISIIKIQNTKRSGNYFAKVGYVHETNLRSKKFIALKSYFAIMMLTNSSTQIRRINDLAPVRGSNLDHEERRENLTSSKQK